MTERLVDNIETNFRELWDGRDSSHYARIPAERLADRKHVCWTSDWVKARWQPERAFGYFKGKP